MKIKRSDREKSSNSSEYRESWCGASELVGEGDPGTRDTEKAPDVMATPSPSCELGLPSILI